MKFYMPFYFRTKVSHLIPYQYECTLAVKNYKIAVMYQCNPTFKTIALARILDYNMKHTKGSRTLLRCTLWR